MIVNHINPYIAHNYYVNYKNYIKNENRKVEPLGATVHKCRNSEKKLGNYIDIKA